jgi:hypothetical protein
VSVLQTWVLVGVPGVVLALGLATGRSVLRARLAYAVLAALVVVLARTEGGRTSAALVGLVAVGLLATGRGSGRTGGPEHHEERRRLTTAGPSAG